MVLEKTLESPLDCKEIQPVHSKGDQSWALMAESEEELKSLLIKVKEESEKSGLNLNIQKMKLIASGPIISSQIDGETRKTVTDCIFVGSWVR